MFKNCNCESSGVARVSSPDVSTPSSLYRYIIYLKTNLTAEVKRQDHRTPPEDATLHIDNCK